MKLTALTILVLFSVNLAKSQNDTIPLLPLNPDLFSGQIMTSVATGETRITSATRQLTTIGQYNMAISLGNEGPLQFGFDTIRKKDVEYFKRFKPSLANKSIVQTAKSRRILMINESHQNPKHRMFTKSLLEDLYANGYRYLAIEALTYRDRIPPFFQDSLLYERKYLLNSRAYGTYISEPRMSNLVRHALELGYQIIDYDGRGKDREQTSAERLSKIFERDENAKLIVHCGWYHILESPDNRNYSWLGHRLKSKTGLDPLTVYQDILSERSYGKESPFYEMMNFDSTLVFINDKGKFYNGFVENEHFDILVYHPRTRYIYNRPHWLIHETNNRFIEIKDINVTYPCLIKAFKETDQHDAIPIDVIEKRFENDPSFLALESGRYRIEIIDGKQNREVQSITIK